MIPFKMEPFNPTREWKCSRCENQVEFRCETLRKRVAVDEGRGSAEYSARYLCRIHAAEWFNKKSTEVKP